MGLFDEILGTDLDPKTDALVRGVLKRYGQFELTGRAGNYLLDKVTGVADMDRENKQLDIAMKKRVLGMQDSEDYEDSVNERTPLWAATTRGVLQRIPEAGFLKPSYGKPILRTATLLGEEAYEHPGVIGRIIRTLR